MVTTTRRSRWRLAPIPAGCCLIMLILGTLLVGADPAKAGPPPPASGESAIEFEHEFEHEFELEERIGWAVVAGAGALTWTLGLVAGWAAPIEVGERVVLPVTTVGMATTVAGLAMTLLSMLG